MLLWSCFFFSNKKGHELSNQIEPFSNIILETHQQYGISYLLHWLIQLCCQAQSLQNCCCVKTVQMYSTHSSQKPEMQNTFHSIHQQMSLCSHLHRHHQIRWCLSVSSLWPNNFYSQSLEVC